MSSDIPSGLTQSVVRALRILTCFSDETPQLRVSDVSTRLDLTPSLVSRLLSTLEHEGFVERDPDTGFYRLGRTVTTLAGISLNHNRLRVESLDEMHRVSRRLGLGVNLSVLGEQAIFYLGHVDSPDTPRGYTLIGRHNPLHATGMGKILLAFLPGAEREALLADIEYTAFTKHTITNPDVLRDELTEVRSRGWSTELEELALGRACVAGPIRDRTGSVVAALSLSGPLSTFRWAERKDELIATLVETTDLISMRLGYVTAPQAGAGGWRAPREGSHYVSSSKEGT